MPTPRVLLGMTLGALVAALGALFLGEYEFDELLPILSGALLGLIVAEVVVSVGRLRTLPLALMVAAWSATAVVLAGYLDSNETEPIKNGAYLSAGLAALAALARANRWRRRSTSRDDTVPTEPTDTETAETEPARTTTVAANRDDDWAGDGDEWVEESPPPAPRRPAPRRAPVDRAPVDDVAEDDDAWPAIPAAPARQQARTARRIEPRPDRSAQAATAEDPPRRDRETGRVRVTARRRPRTGRGR